MIDYDYDFNSYNENYVTITILTFYERKNTYHASFEIIVQIRTKCDISKPLFLFLNNGIGTIFMFYFTSRKKNISELQIIPALEIIGIFKKKRKRREEKRREKRGKLGGTPKDHQKDVRLWPRSWKLKRRKDL